MVEGTSHTDLSRLNAAEFRKTTPLEVERDDLYTSAIWASQSPIIVDATCSTSSMAAPLSAGGPNRALDASLPIISFEVCMA